MMLHEVLVCLAGHTGAVIVRDNDDSTEISRVRRTYVNPAMALTESERALIDGLLITATHVETCRRFCKAGQRSSYYQRALVNGVNELVAAFNRRLCAVEC